MTFIPDVFDKEPEDGLEYCEICNSPLAPEEDALCDACKSTYKIK